MQSDIQEQDVIVLKKKVESEVIDLNFVNLEIDKKLFTI